MTINRFYTIFTIRRCKCIMSVVLCLIAVVYLHYLSNFLREYVYTYLKKKRCVVIFCTHDKFKILTLSID